MSRARPNPVVHLELRTPNLPRACAFYTTLLGWRAESVHLAGGTYLALELGDRLEGGVAEADADVPLWLPYIEVADLEAAIERAVRLGARVEMPPREGPAGWRSVIVAPDGSHTALWRAKPGLG